MTTTVTVDEAGRVTVGTGARDPPVDGPAVGGLGSDDAERAAVDSGADSTLDPAVDRLVGTAGAVMGAVIGGAIEVATDADGSAVGPSADPAPEHPIISNPTMPRAADRSTAAAGRRVPPPAGGDAECPVGVMVFGR